MWTWWQLLCCAFSGEEEEEEEVCQDSQVTQEMLEEQLVRLLTREVLDLLCKCQPLHRSHLILPVAFPCKYIASCCFTEKYN